MAKKTLFQLLREKLGILLTADDIFLGEIHKTEQSILEAVLSLLGRLSVKDGNIVKDTTANRVLATVSRKVRQLLGKSEIDKNVKDFLPNFDQVEKLNNQIYGKILDKVTIPNTGAAKKLAIDQIVSGLSDIRGLETNYEIPLRRKLFEAIEQQMKYTDAVEMVSQYVVGETGKGGNLQRYARQVSMDLLNAYDGYVNQAIADANGLDGFFYSGSLIKTSRQTCIDLVKGAGEFKDLAIQPGLYARETLPAIVKKGKDNGGWRPETTAATFALYRGGYNCRHNLVFVPLAPSERDKVDEIMHDLEILQEYHPDSDE